MLRRDPIVAEVREAREAYAKQFSYDLRAICRDLKEQEKVNDRGTVSLNPKRKTVGGRESRSEK